MEIQQYYTHRSIHGFLDPKWSRSLSPSSLSFGRIGFEAVAQEHYYYCASRSPGLMKAEAGTKTTRTLTQNPPSMGHILTVIIKGNEVKLNTCEEACNGLLAFCYVPNTYNKRKNWYV